MTTISISIDFFRTTVLRGSAALYPEHFGARPYQLSVHGAATTGTKVHQCADGNLDTVVPHT